MAAKINALIEEIKNEELNATASAICGAAVLKKSRVKQRSEEGTSDGPTTALDAATTPTNQSELNAAESSTGDTKHADQRAEHDHSHGPSVHEAKASSIEGR